jgi:ectoine hydroxylase-related dioxygenase (phytanoyl-CoA dioxygenase family)
MKTEDILARPPKVLSQTQRQAYFDDGYLLLPSFVPDATLDELNTVTDQFVDASRSAAPSDGRFDCELDHSPDSPRLRRLNSPVELHEAYRAFSMKGLLVDLAEDLLGPNVKFHHSKLNFKWSDGGEEVKWHQDIQFWPHSNYSPLTIGVYLEDVDDEMGPMGIVPGSHEGELFDLYNDQEEWTGAIKDRELDRAHLEKAVYLKGPKGSVTVHNCRMVHGSMPNTSTRCRPLLLQTYAAADAITLTNLVDNAAHSNSIVRGQSAKWVEFDPRPCLMPPDWSKGYTSIFALQQEEETAS